MSAPTARVVARFNAQITPDGEFFIFELAAPSGSMELVAFPRALLSEFVNFCLYMGTEHARRFGAGQEPAETVVGYPSEPTGWGVSSENAFGKAALVTRYGPLTVPIPMSDLQRVLDLLGDIATSMVPPADRSGLN